MEWSSIAYANGKFPIPFDARVMRSTNAETKKGEPVGVCRTRFERQVPWRISKHTRLHLHVWQFLATSSLVFGAWYLWWRWTASLNTDALWFSLPLVIAETGAFVGLVLFTINIWTDRSPVRGDLPRTLRDVTDDPDAPNREHNLTRLHLSGGLLRPGV